MIDESLLPKLKPSVAELLGRLALLDKGGKTPETMVMSAETWDRLAEEGREVHELIVEDADGNKWFNAVPVKLYEGCLGVGIGYSERRR